MSYDGVSLEFLMDRFLLLLLLLLVLLFFFFFFFFFFLLTQKRKGRKKTKKGVQGLYFTLGYEQNDYNSTSTGTFAWWDKNFSGFEYGVSPFLGPYNPDA